MKKMIAISCGDGSEIHEEVECGRETTTWALDGDSFVVQDHGPFGVLEERDIVRLLARPIWLMQTNGTRVRKGVEYRMFCFTSPAAAALFLVGKSYVDYKLFVGKKLYDWTCDSEMRSTEEHIRACMDVEGAFFENEACLEYFEQERSTRQKFRSGKIDP